MHSLGARVRRWRSARGLSQAAFAALVGVSRNYVSQLERGVSTNPSLEVAQRICHELGMDMHPPQLSPPDCLQQLAEEDRLEPEEVRVLTGIHYRGQQPTGVGGWRAGLIA